MRIAIISDIHSNIHALRAVLDDIARQETDATICTGDLVGYGANPDQVIDTIRNQKILTVMGNYDDGVGNMRPQCGCDFADAESARLGAASLAWTVANTSAGNRAWLARLPRLLELTFGDTSVLFCHGSPRALNEYMFEDSEAIHSALLQAHPATILVCGHTHLPYHKTSAGRHIINAGSVGKPKNGSNKATYVILDVSGGQATSEIKHVAYDAEQAARAIEAAAGLPDEFAKIVRQGK